jgi:hypothetical protein
MAKELASAVLFAVCATITWVVFYWLVPMAIEAWSNRNQ